MKDWINIYIFPVMDFAPFCISAALSPFCCLRNCALFPYSQQSGHDTQPPRTGLTRIPMSKSLKTGKAVLGSLGMSSGVKLDSRAESQSMRIEVKKSTMNGSILQNGGKA